LRWGRRDSRKSAMSRGFFLESTANLVRIDKNRLQRQAAARTARPDVLSSLRGNRLVMEVSEVRPRRMPVVDDTGRMTV
jgi:hypothetical protein